MGRRYRAIRTWLLDGQPPGLNHAPARPALFTGAQRFKLLPQGGRRRLSAQP
jgi:hypothetical protein